MRKNVLLTTCLIFIVISLIIPIRQIPNVVPLVYAQQDENEWKGQLVLTYSAQANSYSKQDIRMISNSEISFKILEDNTVQGTGSGIEELDVTSKDPECTVVGSSAATTFTLQGTLDPNTNKIKLKIVDFSPAGVGFQTTCKGFTLRGQEPVLIAPIPFGGIFGLKDYEVELKDNAKMTEKKDIPGYVATRELTISGSCKVDVWAAAFLPPWTSKGRIPNPAPIHLFSTDPESTEPLPEGSQIYDYHEFSTDSRNIPTKGGSARQWTYVVVDLCSDHTEVLKIHGVGESHGFKLEWNDANQRFEEVMYKARADASGMTETVSALQQGHVKIHMKASTAIPFIRAIPHMKTGPQVAPAIDYEYTITLSKIGNKVKADITGTHDGFPGYEIYIGKMLVYYHTPKVEKNQNPLDPFNSGQTALSLMSLPWPFSAGEFSVDKSIAISEKDAFEKNFAHPQPTYAEEPITRVGPTGL